MFGSAVIVFREALEAALLIGIMAAATRGLAGRGRWITLGVLAGLALSVLVAGFTDVIAQWANGVGQELFNVGVLVVAVSMLAWHNIWMARHGRELAAHARQVADTVATGNAELSAVALVVSMAVLREGSETTLFLYGLAAGNHLDLANVLSGAGIGLLAGAVAGYLLYAGLVRIPLRWLFGVTSMLILLLASGMGGQIARLLIQSDLVEQFSTPLWDSSGVLPMNSSVENLLHVMLGYEARPSGLQVVFYGLTFCLILLGMIWAHYFRTTGPGKPRPAVQNS